MTDYELDPLQKAFVDQVAENAHILGPKSCDKCHRNLDYSETFDAYYCAYCNDWKESLCGDKDCMFCVKRPKIPQKSRRIARNEAKKAKTLPKQENNPGRKIDDHEASPPDKPQLAGTLAREVLRRNQR